MTNGAIIIKMWHWDTVISVKSLSDFGHERSGVTPGPANPASGGAAPQGGGKMPPHGKILPPLPAISVDPTILQHYNAPVTLRNAQVLQNSIKSLLKKLTMREKPHVKW